MRVMKNKVTLLSLAVAGLFAASAAQAVVDLDATTPVVSKFASEAVVPTGGLLLTNAANIMDVTFKLGFGVSMGQDKFVRIDLTNATFNAVVVPANLVDATFAFANTTVVQGGQIGDAYVTFQVTGAAGPHTAADQLTFTMPNVKALATSANVGVSYGLHDTAISAANPPSNATRLIFKSGSVALFTPAVGITALTSVAETAAATTTFQKFCNGAGNTPGTAGCASTATDTDALIGTIATYALNAGVNDPATGMAVASVATIAGATSSVTVTGVDFSGAASIYQSGSVAATFGSCGGPGITSTAAQLTATTGTFTVGNTAYPGTNMNSLCFRANGTSSIPAQTFTAVYNRVSAASATWASGTISLGVTGSIGRDGVELQSPWFTLGGAGTAYISRFFLTNTGATTTCTVTIMTETGNTATLGTAGTNGVTIPGGGQVAVLGTDLVSALSAAGRAAVRFACPAPSSNIQGRYVVTHSSGAVDSGTLIRPGTN